MALRPLTTGLPLSPSKRPIEGLVMGKPLNVGNTFRGSVRSGNSPDFLHL
ncbi:predicted protein [Pyrenophora tritici-repentis Pt-1C-BFP]|uniref:Uncharacterized protein n=1 Tax=Pyrenophora tritici-repentis (strain Pt-1C-BFP) TaxID=426418 RepID=B2WQ31_PYRTR|nr:uncharacterized protein PTRG_12099 [Pyrenophora tritici-repentis Pt-1C-BFP]EDU47284.1 predicted protein [Pyrenophora tritici-repentis Pt-1C-BFP]